MCKVFSQSSKSAELNFSVNLLFSPDVRLFLSLDNPKNAQINDDAEQFGADEADSLVFIYY